MPPAEAQAIKDIRDAWRTSAASLTAGQIHDCRMVPVETGEQHPGAGDRVCFTRNHKQLRVRNGTLGVVSHTSLKRNSHIILQHDLYRLRPSRGLRDEFVAVDAVLAP